MLNWFQMIKTYIINCGKDIQVFINGDSREEAEPIHWSLFNHGATNQTDPEGGRGNTLAFYTPRRRVSFGRFVVLLSI